MSLGLERGVVRLCDHDPEWKASFLLEKSEIETEFADKIIQIEHIGSTAVPGLKAKPIIDLMVAIPSLDSWQGYESGLKKLGYLFRKDLRNTQAHILFVKGQEQNRTHYLKLTEQNSDFWREHLIFRDYLITHADTRKEYEMLKVNLLGLHAGNRASYTDGKKEFIAKVLRQAGFTGKIL